MNDEQTKAPDAEKPSMRARIRYWISVLPGNKIDYFMISLVLLEVIFLIQLNIYGDLFLGASKAFSILAVDSFVVFIWAIYFLRRLRRETDKIEFLKRNWYEVLGLVPFFSLFRPFLLLRATKFAIAFYKLGRSEQDVSSMLTRDITFRFRDIIVDTISDAVFIQSLQRVEEVMLRLDYGKLAHKAFESHSTEMEQVVNDAIANKSVVGELKRVPFMSTVTDRIGKELSEVIKEVMETEVTGNIIKEITGGILKEMTQRVRVLDVERITGTEIDLKKKAQSVMDGKTVIPDQAKN